MDLIKRRLSFTVSRELLIDLEDRLRAEAVKAMETIRDHAGLDRKRAREAEGQLRFRMMVKVSNRSARRMAARPWMAASSPTPT